MNVSQQVSTAVAKVTPPVGVVIMGHFVTMNDAVQVVTLIYVLVQLAYLAAKWQREAQDRHAQERNRQDRKQQDRPDQNINSQEHSK